MKPDWKDAPWWATFLAQDANGDWYWYQYEPEAGGCVPGKWGVTSGQVLRNLVTFSDWAETLEERPQ